MASVTIPGAETITNLKDDAMQFWQEISSKHKRANILVAGKTGVGKSSLINAVFRDQLAETGLGRPVTQQLNIIYSPGVPLNILDTKGLELEDYESIKGDILNEVRRRRSTEDDDYVHVAWLCIEQEGKRIEEAEISLAKDLAELGVQIIVVLTKCHNFKDTEFSEVVKEKFHGIVHNIVLTRGIETPRYDEDENIIGNNVIRGIDELIHTSYEVIPEAQKQAFSDALNIRNKEAIIKKKEEAKKVIQAASGAAAVVGAAPIPFSDAFLLFPIQAVMIVKISGIFGMSVSKDAIMPVITTLGGSTVATVIGKSIVTGIMKMIPGLGSFIGGALSATVAGKLTTGMGEAYMAGLLTLVEEGKPLDLASALAVLKSKVSS